jgi:hypothetical protein
MRSMPAVGMTVTKALFAVSGNSCYFDRCEQRLTNSTWTRVTAEIAHICGHRPGSARYDPTLTSAELQITTPKSTTSILTATP